MSGSASATDVFLELGSKRVFASAVDWPGWCRSGRDSGSALAALVDYGPRYERTVASSRLGFLPPADPAGLFVVEQLKGNATTDFGAPGIPAAQESRPLGSEELSRLEKILKACWVTFDRAVEGAKNRPLRKGPRGGGRELEAIVWHVLGAEEAYLSRLGWPFKLGEGAGVESELARCRHEIVAGLAAALRGEIEPQGARGGRRWPARYFIRRSAWHVLDHAWEIEDRSS